MSIKAEWLGRVDYKVAWDLQKKINKELTSNPYRGHHLLLLEHPHTYTIGRGGDRYNLLLNEAELKEREISLYNVDRGGDITYHGPGQLVAYPIFNIKKLYGRGIGRTRQYVNKLEEILILTLSQFGVDAGRFEGYRGVWVETQSGLKKIAAIGVRVNAEGISSHGFALNVNPDLSYYSGIIPCGIQDYGVISMAQLTGNPITTLDILPTVENAFKTVFNLQVIREDREHA